MPKSPTSPSGSQPARASARKPALRWKMAPKDKGLYAIVAGPRSHELYEGGKLIARVSALRARNGTTTGWYMVAGWQSDLPRINTCNKPVKTPEEAKAAAMEYVRERRATKPATGTPPA